MTDLTSTTLAANVRRLRVARRLSLSELALPPGHAHELEPRGAGTREELLVLRGTVLAGPVERVSELSAGDYASFPGDVARLVETRRHGASVLLIGHAA